MKILAIETSCDETSASVIEGKIPDIPDKKEFYEVRIISNIVSSQVKIHSKWGGVVPNLAAREHLKNIIPVIDEALNEAGTKMEKINVIAVTQGPGLIPALLIGTNAAKALSYFYKKPLLGIHHIEGHIYANFVRKVKSQSRVLGTKVKSNNIEFPILSLVVSGGHTQLVMMKSHLKYEIIGQTLDDAAGEAFDKVAKILDIGYPGGPIVSKLAQEARKKHLGLRKEIKVNRKSSIKNCQSQITLPRPMLNSKNLDFSFSGLKTAVLYFYKKIEEEKKSQRRLDLWKKYICKEFEDAAVEVLVKKTIRAAKKYRPRTVLLAGGVAANSHLKSELSSAIEKEFPGMVFSYPPPALCGDNAAMMGVAAFYRYILSKNKKQLHNNWKSLESDANMKL